MIDVDKSLTICILNYNTSDFILNTLYCLEKITKNSYKVIIRDNNSKIEDYLNLKRNIKKYSNVELYRVKNFNYIGSMAHGIGMNDLTKRINTKYGVILDPDCIFLYRNWDEILINELNNKCQIIGTQAPYHPRSKKYRDFPLIYAVLFSTEVFKKLNIDFLPLDPKNYKDVGYELRNKYLKNGYKGKLLIYKNTRIYKKGPFRKLICAEYYLEGYENIFASHFGRGATLGANKYLRTSRIKLYKLSFFGFKFVGKFFLKLRGKKEKRKWIKICRKIVDNYD